MEACFDRNGVSAQTFLPTGVAGGGEGAGARPGEAVPGGALEPGQPDRGATLRGGRTVPAEQSNPDPPPRVAVRSEPLGLLPRKPSSPGPGDADGDGPPRKPASEAPYGV